MNVSSKLEIKKAELTVPLSTGGVPILLVVILLAAFA